MNHNLNTSKDDSDFCDYHDVTDEKLYVIKCIVGLTNHYFSVMINGKPSNPIGNIHLINVLSNPESKMLSIR